MAQRPLPPVAVAAGPPPSPDSRVLTIPNALSVLRLCLLPVFLWLVLGPEADALAAVLLMALGASDYLDGYLARRLGQTSRLGMLLDPVADRVYVLVVVVGLGLREIIPLWLVVALPARDLLLWGLLPFLRAQGRSALPVHFLGKAATAALLYGFPLLLLGAGDGGWATAARVVGWAFTLWGVGMYWCAGVLYAYQVHLLGRRQAAR